MNQSQGGEDTATPERSDDNFAYAAGDETPIDPAILKKVEATCDALRAHILPLTPNGTESEAEVMLGAIIGGFQLRGRTGLARFVDNLSPVTVGDALRWLHTALGLRQSPASNDLLFLVCQETARRLGAPSTLLVQLEELQERSESRNGRQAALGL